MLGEYAVAPPDGRQKAGGQPLLAHFHAVRENRKGKIHAGPSHATAAMLVRVRLLAPQQVTTAHT